jgi:hypothetical protein
MLATTPLTPFASKMNVKPKKESLENPSHSMPCWHINEKNHRLIDEKKTFMAKRRN